MRYEKCDWLMWKIWYCISDTIIVISSSAVCCQYRIIGILWGSVESDIGWATVTAATHSAGSALSLQPTILCVTLLTEWATAPCIQYDPPVTGPPGVSRYSHLMLYSIIWVLSLSCAAASIATTTEACTSTLCDSNIN